MTGPGLLPSRRHQTTAWRIGAAVVLCGLAVVALAQQPAPTPTPTPTRPAAAKLPLGSDWSDLTPAQQVALKPLGPSWGTISTGQKRKWIALSRNFQTLSPAAQTKLHARMTEWINLSAVQRSEARLNFAQTQQLSPDQKKAEWEAYLALPLEQRQQLATGQALPVGAAPARQPVDPNKLAAVPITRSESSPKPTPVVKPRPPREAASASRPARPASGAQASR